jgi:hypothetical protein
MQLKANIYRYSYEHKENINNEQRAVNSVFRAVETASRSRDKLRIPPVEWLILQDEQHVPLNPQVKMAVRQQNSF